MRDSSVVSMSTYCPVSVGEFMDRIKYSDSIMECWNQGVIKLSKNKVVSLEGLSGIEKNNYRSTWNGWV